jgi:hypothetical protein
MLILYISLYFLKKSGNYAEKYSEKNYKVKEKIIFYVLYFVCIK